MFPLSTSTTIPRVGLGTFLCKPPALSDAIEVFYLPIFVFDVVLIPLNDMVPNQCAIRNGYRHLDLAPLYENQVEIGAVLKKVVPSVVRREDLFITSKLWNSAHQPDQVEKELDSTLRQLGLDYLDLYLIHFPVSFKPHKGFYPLDPDSPDEVELDLETSLVDTWKAMINLRNKGKVKQIGVSNFTIKHMEGIIKATGVVPTANQIEAHPLLPQDELVEFCHQCNIHIIAFCSLGNNSMGKPLLTEHPTVQAVAKRLGATPAQVLLAWAIYRGYSVIPKSVQEERIISNFKLIELSESDYEEITRIGKGNYTRYDIPYKYTPKWNINVFDEPEEKAAKHKVKIQ